MNAIVDVIGLRPSLSTVFWLNGQKLVFAQSKDHEFTNDYRLSVNWARRRMAPLELSSYRIDTVDQFVIACDDKSATGQDWCRTENAIDWIKGRESPLEIGRVLVQGEDATAQGLVDRVVHDQRRSSGGCG